jgi:hypothetical protein
MNDYQKEPDNSMVQCPVCSGHGTIRGSQTGISWFDCAWCDGIGGVTEKRYYAWHYRNARFAVEERHALGGENES